MARWGPGLLARDGSEPWGRFRWDPPLRWVTSSSSPQWGKRRYRTPEGMRRSASGLRLTKPPSGGACCVPRDKSGYAALQRDLVSDELGLASCEKHLTRASSHRPGPCGAIQVVATWSHLGPSSCPRCPFQRLGERGERRGSTLGPTPYQSAHDARTHPPCRLYVLDAPSSRSSADADPAVRDPVVRRRPRTSGTPATSDAPPRPARNRWSSRNRPAVGSRALV